MTTEKQAADMVGLADKLDTLNRLGRPRTPAPAGEAAEMVRLAKQSCWDKALHQEHVIRLAARCAALEGENANYQRIWKLQEEKIADEARWRVSWRERCEASEAALAEARALAKTVPPKPEGNLWRAVYSVQGQAQQAAEGGFGGKCWPVEEAWTRIRNALLAEMNKPLSPQPKTEGTK